MLVFSLNEVRVEQIKNIANNTFASWPENATYGYFGGGYTGPPGISATINRFNFSTDTLNLPGNNLPLAIARGATVTSNSFGYFGGGSYGGPGISVITRLDFSNETISDPGKNLSIGSRLLGGVTGISYGYFIGGSTPGSDSRIQRLDFSNETTYIPGKNLPSGRSPVATVSSSLYGYVGSGGTNLIAKIDFSTENISTPGNNLPNSRTSLSGVSSSSYGYFGGGYTWPPAIVYNTITRLNFDTETISNNSSTLTGISRAESATISNNSYGYFAGGFYSPPYTYVSTITRLDFFTENTTNPGNNYPQNINGIYAMSGGASVYRNARGFGTYGYFGGGYSGTPQPPPFTKNLVCRLDFSTENFTPIGNLGSSRYNGYGFSNNNYGYFAGGQSTPGVIYSAGANTIEFATNTISVAGPFGVSRAGGASFSSKYCGYAVGGNPTSSLVSFAARRYDFSTGVGSYTSQLIYGIYNGYTGIESQCYGYISKSNQTSFYRFDFSNETIDESANKFPTSFFNSTGISHTSRGYFIGGSGPSVSKTSVARLDFANETASDTGKNLPTPKQNISGTQSELYGYLVGGAIPVAPPTLRFDEISNVTRFDFSTEDLTDISPTYPTPMSHMATCTNHNKYNLVN
jgi:hypothetical protein